MKHSRFSRALSLALCLVLSLCTLSALTVIGTAAADVTDISDNVSSELPPLFDDCDDFFEFEDCFNQDGSGFNANKVDGSFTYYYLKGTYEESYMRFTFEVKQAGTYQLCIGLMGFPGDIPRSAEVSVNGGERFYFIRNYSGLGDMTAEYISGMTVYCREGENSITVFLGHDFDNTTVKSLFFDNFYLVRVDKLPADFVFPGEEIIEVPIDVSNASKEVIKFDQNFRPLVNAVNYCRMEYVEDADLGQVMSLTVDQEYIHMPDMTLSYTKLLRAMDISDEEPICDQYEALVVAVKADEEHTLNPEMTIACFTNGNNMKVGGTIVTESYEADGKWQYIVFDMTYADHWYGTLNGFDITFASDVEVGANIQIGEIRLFKTLDNAFDYADIKMGYVKDETTDTEVVTDEAPTEDSGASTVGDATVGDATVGDSTVGDATVADATQAPADATDAETKTAENTGCASVVSAAVLCLIVACAGFMMGKKH